LPSPRIGLSAAPWGGLIYIFGGHSNGTMITEILRFDPATEDLSVMGASLVTGRAGMCVISMERGIYLFGGKTQSGSSDEVILYEPGKDSLTVLPERLPYPVYHASAVWTGERAFIIGGSAVLPGWNVSKATDAITEFHPASGVSKISSARLPSPRERTVAAFHGGTIFVFGGQEGVRALDDIVTIGTAKNGANDQDALVMRAAVIAVLVFAAFALVLAGTRRR
jgi:N-acetylneuraminic acid mutarotase